MSQPLAFCITTLHPGGAERQLAELVLRMPTAEFTPHVVALAEPPESIESIVVDRLKDGGVPVTFLNAPGMLAAPTTIVKLKRYFQQLQPVLVQSFLAHANIAATVAARAAGVRPVVTGIRVAERRANLHAWLARRTERWVARHVCVSHSVAEFAIRDMQLDPRKVVMIPNGVDVETFAQAQPLERLELGLPSTARVVLHVGRLDSQKRIDWLLARFAEALPRLPDTYLLLAGSGSSQVYLTKRSAQLGIVDRVRFLGWRGDVPRLLASCDALVLTSAWEGMPNAVLEAMAAARPVLATEVEGVREVLGSALAAEQVVGRDEATLFVERLVCMLRDRDRAAEVGQANQARARQRFSLDETARRYASLYRELLL
ncbi:MAG: glycosyltransferase [Pirellulales bacterium]